MFKNPLTTILGYIILVLTWAQQVFVTQAIPQNGKDWFTFAVQNAMGLAALFSKDFNKTNATIPAETHVNTTTAPAVTGLPSN